MKEYRKCLILAVVVVLVVLGLCVCPNNCNNHGTCVGSSCICYERNGIDDGKSYTGNDCSLLKCMDGNSFSFVSSQSSGISGSSYTRELSDDVPMNIRLLADVKMVLIADYSADPDKIWKVEGISELLKYLPKMGGSIQCSYKVGEKQQTNVSVDVIGVFDNKTTAFARFTTTITQDTVITCSQVLTKRSSMIYYNLNGVIATVSGSARQLTDSTSTLTWGNYGKIFQELGLLELEEVKEDQGSGERRNLAGEKIYVNSNFTFACYTPPTSNNVYPIEIKIHNKVKASYTEGKDGLVFTFTDPATLPKEGDVCYCLMSGELLPMKIQQTELNNYISISENKYTLGKYSASGLDGNDYAVIMPTADTKYIAASQSTTSLTIDSSYTALFGEKRVVYVDVYSSGIISEKEVTVTTDPRIRQLQSQTPTIELDGFISGDIVFPYIKLHSLNPLNDTKPSTPNTKGSAYYKVYNLADKLIKQLDKSLGGILKCSYTKDNVNVVTSIDVKRYETVPVGDSNKVVVAYSYAVLSINDFDKIPTLKCTEIATKRKDYTMYNPVKLTADNYKSNELTWKGYGALLTGFTDQTTVNLACYTPNNNNTKEKFTLYDDVKITAESETDVKFTLKNTGDEDAKPTTGDICYLAAKVEENAVKAIAKENLLSSDLGAYIREGEGEDNYYYGKYIKTDEPIQVERSEDLLPVFIFDNKNNKITESTIEIVENDIQNEDLEYFQIGQTIYIEVISNNDNTIQYNHKAIIISLNSRLLSSDSTRTFQYSPRIPTGFSPTGVLTPTSLTAESAKIDDSVEIDKSKYLYKVTDFYGTLLSGLPKLGGKVQCKYVLTKKSSDERRYLTELPEMSVIDVKTYKSEDSYSYIQFDREMENKPDPTSTPVANTYYLQDMTCNREISRRGDMTFFNPTTINTGAGGNYANHILTWKGYALIFKDIGFTITEQTLLVKFACYNGDKKIVIYDGVTVSQSQSGGGSGYDIQFTFLDEKEPSNGDICHLLTTSSGSEIDIENSDLKDLIRKDGDDYYYGKYELENNTSHEIVKNDDGSQTVILGKGLFSDNEGEDGKVYVGKIDDENSPSIAYPPSLISDGIKKLMVAGTIMIFKQGGNTQYSQILKVTINSKNKFELSLSDSIYLQTGRLLATVPSTLLEMTFASKSSVHPPLECSGQGLCNRESGLCECYDGYSGSACQRLDCPNNCNGNGRCVPLSELLSNEELDNNYGGFGNKHDIFDNQVYGCLCDKRHRGYDCSLIECPSSVDPEGATNTADAGKDEMRDCSGRGICNYNTGVCECFDGFSGEGCQTQSQMM